MAVEARHINPFPSQLINRNLMMNNNDQEAAAFMMRPASSFNVSQSSSQQLMFHQYFTSNNADDINTFATTTVPEQKLFSSHRQQPNNNPMMYESSLHAKTESGLTFNNIIPNSRKRSRDDATNTNQIYTDFQKNLSSVPQPLCPPSSLLGDDSLPAQILQQHQYEVEALISQHTKKIRLELAEKQRQHARSLLSSLSQAMAKKLKEKEEQIARMGKENIALQERVKALYVENQLWRDLAQTNEATANSLRTNLEQLLLSHVSNEEHTHVVDDVESCCGSSGDHDEDNVDDGHDLNRWCKICSERESCVLLLPCRHLCLCAVCGQAVKACPVCHCSMNATVHVNLSAS